MQLFYHPYISPMISSISDSNSLDTESINEASIKQFSLSNIDLYTPSFTAYAVTSSKDIALSFNLFITGELFPISIALEVAIRLFILDKTYGECVVIRKLFFLLQRLCVSPINSTVFF